MPEPRSLTFLCITTYEKGQEFMRECKRRGCCVILVTADKLRDADWPRESLDDTFYLPAEISLSDIVQAVRTWRVPGNSIASSRLTSTKWRLPQPFASICACRAWGSQPCAISATSSPCA